MPDQASLHSSASIRPVGRHRAVPPLASLRVLDHSDDVLRMSDGCWAWQKTSRSEEASAATHQPSYTLQSQQPSFCLSDASTTTNPPSQRSSPTGMEMNESEPSPFRLPSHPDSSPELGEEPSPSEDSDEFEERQNSCMNSAHAHDLLPKNHNPQGNYYDTYTIRQWFMQMDADHSGEISKDEFISFLRNHKTLSHMMLMGSQVQMSDSAVSKTSSPETAKRVSQALAVRRLIKLFNEMDKDGNQSMDWEEFLEFFRRAGYLLEYTTKDNPRDRAAEIIAGECQRLSASSTPVCVNAMSLHARRGSEASWASEQLKQLKKAEFLLPRRHTCDGPAALGLDKIPRPTCGLRQELAAELQSDVIAGDAQGRKGAKSPTSMPTRPLGSLVTPLSDLTNWAPNDM